MDMIGNERPTKANSVGLGDDITQTFDEIIPVLVICKYASTFDSANNDMMKGAGSVYASFALRGIFSVYHR